MKRFLNLKWFLLSNCFLLLFLFLIFCNQSSFGFAETNKANKVSSHVYRYGVSKTSRNKVLLFTPKQITVCKENPEEVGITVFAFNLSKKGKVNLNKLTLADAKGDRKEVPLRISLKTIFNNIKDENKILKILESENYHELESILKKDYCYYDEVPVSLKELHLKNGDSATITVTASFETTSASIETISVTQISVASLPPRAGWQGGDGHIHTDWSPDVRRWDYQRVYTIYNRARDAYNAGFNWQIITDHSDGIDLYGGWNSYVSECNTAQNKYGIVVAPGCEITSGQQYGNQGDALGYYMKSNPRNNYYSPQRLINEINNNNDPYSCAVIAHPYIDRWWVPDRLEARWPDWNVTGFRAMELLSNERLASNETISTWFDRLRRGLSNTLLGKGFVVGLGNTDTHFADAPGHDGFTWAHTFAPSPGKNGNWVLVSNSGSSPTEAVIKIEGLEMARKTLSPGAIWTPIFPGVIGGSVEVKSSGQKLITSQRVHYYQSFNEVMGTRQEDLGTRYYFLWYDQASPGFAGNWILVGNPSINTQTAQVAIYIAGVLKGTYSIPPGGRVTPNYPGVRSSPRAPVKTRSPA